MNTTKEDDSPIQTLISTDTIRDQQASTQRIASKFGSPDELIKKLDSQMGLGKLDTWTNMAGGYDMGEYMSTLEYYFGPPMPPTRDVKTTIELTIGSKDKSGSTVEYVKLDIGFINPSYKSEAKKRYVNDIKKLEKVLKVTIPPQIWAAIEKEQNLKLSSEGYQFEHEKYGGTREFLALTIR